MIYVIVYGLFGCGLLYLELPVERVDLISFGRSSAAECFFQENLNADVAKKQKESGGDDSQDAAFT